MDNLFFTLWDCMNTKVVYITPKDLGYFEYHVREYSKKKPLNETMYVLYYFAKEYKKKDYEAQNIFVIQCPTNFEPFFLYNLLSKDPFFRSPELIPEVLALYEKIHLPYSSFEANLPKTEERRNYVESQIETVYKKNLSRSTLLRTRLEQLGFDVRNEEIFTSLLHQLKTFVNTAISAFPTWVDLELFASMYSFPYFGRIMPCIHNVNTVVFNDVYYKNKQWYDADKKPLILDDYDNDFEYRFFPKKEHTDITSDEVVEVSKEVLYLDYIYGFYNFGEFWDILKRLLYVKSKNMPLFRLERNRVTDITVYFQKFDSDYSSHVLCKPNTLYHFQSIHMCSLRGGTRGIMDRFFTYQLNRIMNPEPPVPFSYRIYMTRGSFGRSIVNEGPLIDFLKEKHNFVIMNGSETRAETMYYFTNASLMLGAHGSLMKNKVWCKKNPIFVELTPLSRSANPCFISNAFTMGLQLFYFICDCDDKEQIHLRDTQRTALFELIDKLCTIA